MRNCNSIISAVVAISAIAGIGAASAADLPARHTKAPAMVVDPAYNWTGFYIGLSGGGSESSQSFTSTAGITTGKFTGSGGLVGGTIGYNYQVNKFVFGLEGDASWANINANDTTTGGCIAEFPCSANISFLGTARGRLGLAADRWLFYVTGGGALANFTNDQSALSPLAHSSGTKAGWTVGGGVEAALWGNWSAKAEYLYVDIGQTPFCPATGCGVVVVSDYTHLNIVRVGLNYWFGGPIVAKY
jgi:outer membrane immunogenic protein